MAKELTQEQIQNILDRNSEYIAACRSANRHVADLEEALPSKLQTLVNEVVNATNNQRVSLQLQLADKVQTLLTEIREAEECYLAKKAVRDAYQEDKVVARVIRRSNKNW